MLELRLQSRMSQDIWRGNERVCRKVVDLVGCCGNRYCGGAAMILFWLALHMQLACAGTSDELRGGLPAIAKAVATGRCEVVL